MSCVTCLEAYSTGLSVDTNANIPLNSTSISKGCSVVKTGATIQFNKCGLYKLYISATATATEEGKVTIQVQKDGVNLPNAVYSSSASAAAIVRNLSGTTCIQVNHNNGPCACASPTIVTITNAGIPVTYDLIDVVVTKIDD